MSGVVGFTHTRSVADPGRIRNALSCLIHRGPDGSGFFESPRVSLGVARLHTTQRGSVSQPFVSPDGATAVALDGEIFNQGELRADLERRGHFFQTAAAAETMLAAFREWDTGCLVRLRGIFAAALWSEAGGRLVLARDRMGIKPLYLACHRGDLYFASEIKGIFAHPEIERRLSLAGLDCYFSLNYVPCPWTLAEGVEKLPPAHWLEWRDGRVRSEPYWRLPEPDGAPPEHFWTLDAARGELDSLLKQSMRERLLADDSPGVWLNSGVDSSTILHYAASAVSGPLKTYSIPGNAAESEAIRRIAAEYGTVHQQVDFDEALGLPAVVQELPYYFDEPGGDAAALPLWFLANRTHRTSSVALAGVGAAELFGGCPNYRTGLLAETVRRFPRGLLRMAASAAGAVPSPGELLQRFFEGCLLAPEESHIFWSGGFSSAEKRALAGPLPRALPRVLADLATAGAPLPAWLRFDQKYRLPDATLAAVDRMSMAHSLEVRPPFLDHRIVEFAAALPPRLKICGARRKILLRELMKAKAPAAIRKRDSNGFEIPAAQWLRGPLRPLLTETLESGAAEYADLFHPPFIQECLRRFLAGRAHLSRPLWGLMILFLWMKRWRIRTTLPHETGLEAPSIFTSV